MIRPLAALGLVALLSMGPSAAPQNVQAPAGLTVVLVIDLTASVSRVPLPIDQRFAQAYNGFVQGLKPSDRAAVGVIADKTHFGPLTGDLRQLSASARLLLQVPDANRLGPSPLWDAVDEAIALASSDPSGRPAVILFSDGKSTGNVHGLDEVVAHAKKAGVIVSAVLEGPSSAYLVRLAESPDPGELMGRLTDATGGLRLLDRPPDPRQRNPGPMVAEILNVLHQKN